MDLENICLWGLAAKLSPVCLTEWLSFAQCVDGRWHDWMPFFSKYRWWYSSAR